SNGFIAARSTGVDPSKWTTLPPISPVAWSSFQTGCNPGRHRIFDFLVPNRKSYLPELCSAQIRPPSRSFSLGKYRIPIGKPVLRLGRKSKPFWKTLGEHGIFSAVLRVPITFPPEKFNGVMLSAMAVPDLKGSQGTYTYYSSDEKEEFELTSGIRIPVQVNGGVVKTHVIGPENSLLKKGGEMVLPMEIRITGESEAELTLVKETYTLTRKEYTPWITVDFKAGLGIKVRGIFRLYLLETSPNFKLYMTPINIDPGKPALPVSHPFTYAIYLAKTMGPYATLGLAEDTSALNEGVVDEEAFLKQTYLIHEEREKMYFDAIDKVRRGLVVCVFDITDRIQHMFFRYLQDDHPANRGRDVEKHRDVIKNLYKDMDDLLGRTMEAIDGDDVLIVMSDHGFKPFRRGVNINTWLYKNGFLAVKGEEPTGADMLQEVDWSGTKAYAVGFGGIYLNIAGREAKGIVKPGEEAEAVKKEIIEGLRALYDEKEQKHAVREVYSALEVYKGPYVRDAPDLIVGFRIGYRVSWGSVTGKISKETIEDNDRPWSGDHNFNPPDVPGMLFTNMKIAAEDPGIMDIGPTVLDLFGVPIPAYCDGKSLLDSEGGAKPEASEPSRAPEEMAGV
ncbi:alkaline phosphatase family protein, partial [Candidatus Sumerlaeota bacterium]|nr:alkaline phosphatase family protein [Candidatus Sumerlaeota bacterium]